MKECELKNITVSLYSNRDKKAIKSDFGKALFIGGSLKYPNAILIAAKFSTLSGNGYSVIAPCKSNYAYSMNRLPLYQICEDVYLDNDDFSCDKIKENMSKYDSILFGNGIAINQNNYECLKAIIKHYSGNLVIDASGITLLATFGKEILKEKKCEIILTPHLGEVKKLLNSDIVSREPIEYLNEAKDFAKDYQVTLLLKSYYSLFIDKYGNSEEIHYNDSQILAKAGSGDALAGFLTGLLAYYKKFSEANMVIYADMMFHKAASLAMKDLPAGLGNIEDIYNYLEKLIISFCH